MFVCFSSLLNNSSKILVKSEAQGLQTQSFAKGFTPDLFKTGTSPDYTDSYLWPAISTSDTTNASGNCWSLAASKHLEKYPRNQKGSIQPNVLPCWQRATRMP